MRNLIYPIIGATLGSAAVWLTSPQFEDFLAARWLEVENVVVTPRPQGQPIVTMDRKIHRPFTATWVTTIRRQEGVGFVPVCRHSGQNDYLPDTVLPQVPDLNWFLGVPPQEPCGRVTAGRYKVSFVWIIQAGSSRQHTVRAESNLFTIAQ
jgi:hypothetical protein